jgi:N-acetyl-anhydromuramyl-L-alanine amidase AmpD
VTDYLAAAPWLPPLGWKPSPNFGTNRHGCRIDQITIHDMEGHLGPSEELFEERSSQVSAHYCVSADGQVVDQMVDDADRAWHACDFNDRSLGIEMEGFARLGYSRPQLVATARLAAHLASKYGIPIRYAKGGVGAGIVSHWSYGKAGGGHSDPEPNDQFVVDFVALVDQEFKAGRYPEAYTPADLQTPADPARHDLTTTLGVQNALHSMHFDVACDGQIGPETEAVVASFQTIAGLKSTGGNDDATRAAIQKALSGG